MTGCVNNCSHSLTLVGGNLGPLTVASSQLQPDILPGGRRQGSRSWRSKAAADRRHSCVPMDPRGAVNFDPAGRVVVDLKQV